MIQDRVKELREIVPNGAKCSIDALLERTIKHMPFLQSVTKHAVKLKPTGESKVWMEYPVMSKMLCEENGFFLEIADLIRGLELTILRGVMKAQNDKIWARFAVEANKDITRMEIFLSLVRLLEQTVTGNIASTMALETNPLMGIMHSLKLHQSLQLSHPGGLLFSKFGSNQTALLDFVFLAIGISNDLGVDKLY
ncbi:hypothetical protein K2173_027013 [Erythroxylum novogranatense]|uniref:BHLH domain-containing protein n=1 Tax=Erythroxylum novogranatense TaxID=1862640 RepID=A0AAV8TXU6_9ROSI|nr:hypothetical protein K2173_027013 [Erythroxylum novogranatense]